MVDLREFEASLHLLLEDQLDEMLDDEQKVQVVENLNDSKDLVGFANGFFRLST